jgi:hypothetical protein
MSGNYMQKIYDVLRASPSKLSVADMSVVTGLERRAIRHALQRLRRLHVLDTSCEQQVWLYGIKAGAQRPNDARGRPKHNGSAA